MKVKTFAIGFSLLASSATLPAFAGEDSTDRSGPGGTGPAYYEEPHGSARSNSSAYDQSSDVTRMPEQSYGSIAGGTSESLSSSEPGLVDPYASAYSEKYYLVLPADTIVLIPMLEEEESAQHVPG